MIELMITYGFWNGFSSTSLYDSWLIQGINILYASIPIIIFAVFDESDIREALRVKKR